MSDMNSFNNPQEVNQPVKQKRETNKRNIIIVTMVVLLIVGGIASLGFARGFYDNHRGDNHRGKGHGPLGMLMDIAVKDLDLNDQQKKEVEAIKDEIKAKMETKRGDRKEDMDQMLNMFRSDNFDKSKALELMKQHDADRDEMRSFMLDETTKFHAILTPDQRNKLADKVKEFRSKHDEFRNKFDKEK